MDGKNETKSIENIEDWGGRMGVQMAIIKWSRLIFRVMWRESSCTFI